MTNIAEMQPESPMPAIEARTLCCGFMSDLTGYDGILRALKDHVAKDDTLMIGLRDASINLYYRGGSITKLTRVSERHYKAFFDRDYCKPSQLPMPDLPAQVTDTVECGALIKAIPALKEIMNVYLAGKSKSEREFQQLVVWENNRSSIANETEYFITDIEFASPVHSARLDMLGLKWLAKDRKSGARCKPVLIEMKWGDDAYDGNAGIIQHIKGLDSIMQDGQEIDKIRKMIGRQFDQLRALGLLGHTHSDAVKTIDMVEKPEVVFILANHNPRSGKLLKILDKIELPDNFDLRFFVANFAGYGMHEACMLELADFRELVARFLK